jgi:pSer/pThr/pTyr-binding forkhead associated (FHA) protein
MPDQEQPNGSFPLLSQNAQVIVEVEGRILATHPLDKGVMTVGSGRRSDIALPPRGVARLHALIRWIDGRWVIEDRGSMTGLVYNGKSIEHQHTLRDGDHIFLSRWVVLRFQAVR